MRITGDGTVNICCNLGIGTITPQAALEVRGNIKLGGIGQYFAPSGEENLRIVRGIVGTTGNIIGGSGFTVTHDASGQYTVTFNTSFSGPPAVIATGVGDGTSVAMAAPVTSISAIFLVSDLRPDAGSHADRTFHFIAIGPR